MFKQMSIVLALALAGAGCFENRGKPQAVPTVKGAAALAATNRAAMVRVLLRGDPKAGEADFASLTAVETLDLSETGLKGIPEKVWGLKTLREFYFVRNGLKELPAGIAQLAALTYLNLDGNQLSALPPEMGSLAALKFLRLNDNPLQTLPAAIGQLTDLRRIYLKRCRFASVPEVLKSCTQLEDIALDGNALTAVPDWLVTLPKLKSVSLAGTRVAKLPEDLSGWRGLSFLHLSNCPIAPAEMARIRAALPDVAIVF